MHIIDGDNYVVKSSNLVQIKRGNKIGDDAPFLVVVLSKEKQGMTVIFLGFCAFKKSMLRVSDLCHTLEKAMQTRRENGKCPTLEEVLSQEVIVPTVEKQIKDVDFIIYKKESTIMNDILIKDMWVDIRSVMRWFHDALENKEPKILSTYHDL